RRSSEALGAALYAVRSGVARALMLRRRGMAAEAAEAADRAWRESIVAGYERAGLFARLQEDVALSAREQEILSMLAGRLTTGDIARALQMSMRTVETHVHNISRKVGVSGRDQLAGTAATWLRAD
ncbi:MAG: helix-turn-helix transcriptional regulator, partial [Nocardioides sp.]|nr:helix-turn-helix transcriptional regulator [Nocardioides sp.]